MRIAATRLLFTMMLLSAHGCVSESVLSAWNDSARISSLGLRARPIDSSRFEIAWRARAQSTLQLSSGVMELDTRLDQCDQVEILATDGSDTARLDAENERIFAFGGARDGRAIGPPAPKDPRECQVLLRINRSWDMPPAPTATILASTENGELGRARIAAPRNPLWLGLMPLTATADAVLFPVYLCSEPSGDNLCAQLAIEVIDGLY